MKKRVYNFNLPDELRSYLKERANKRYTTMSGYLIGLIEKDRLKHESLNYFKENKSD
jgi:hypothetical protein